MHSELKEFLTLGLYGDGEDSKNLACQARQRQEGSVPQRCLWNSFCMDQAGGRFLCESCQQGQVVAGQGGSRQFVFSLCLLQVESFTSCL